MKRSTFSPRSVLSALHGRVGLLSGIATFILVLTLHPEESALSSQGWRVAALGAWMAIWWLSEAVPLSITALLPLIFLPLLGVSGLPQAAAPYAHPVVFLILGGFILAEAMRRWQLHRRFAFLMLSITQGSLRYIVGAFMVSTAIISAGMTNTASTVMMLPIALSVLEIITKGQPLTADHRRLSIALPLALAYSASIGGMTTLIGTAPNALLAAYVRHDLSRDLSFIGWFAMAAPIALLLLLACWIVLVFILHPLPAKKQPRLAQQLEEQRRALGPMTRAERNLCRVLLATVLAWILRPFLADIFPDFPMSDTMIALIAAASLFLIPSGKNRQNLLDDQWSVHIPWSILLLFGGGLSLASAVTASGLAAFIASLFMGITGWPILIFIVILIIIVLLLTELTSNTATTIIFLPIVGHIALQSGIDPMIVLAPMTMAVSCAFMLPVATPPNAIVFAGGTVSMRHMLQAGIRLNLIAVPIISLGGYFLASWIL